MIEFEYTTNTTEATVPGFKVRTDREMYGRVVLLCYEWMDGWVDGWPPLPCRTDRPSGSRLSFIGIHSVQSDLLPPLSATRQQTQSKSNPSNHTIPLT